MHVLIIQDFANEVQSRPADEVVKVICSEAPMRVWVLFRPGFQMVEAQNSEEVLEWGRQARKLEDF